jgi:hypothetical protein
MIGDLFVAGVALNYVANTVLSANIL